MVMSNKVWNDVAEVLGIPENMRAMNKVEITLELDQPIKIKMEGNIDVPVKQS